MVFLVRFAQDRTVVTWGNAASGGGSSWVKEIVGTHPVVLHGV
jgi:hypothetical protein